MQQERSRMLGEMPIDRLVPKIAVPIMISMLVQALYNVVDSIFVARYDADALTAVSLASPMQMLIIALAVGMGVGINSLISRRLGEGRRELARTAAWNGAFIELVGALIFVVIGLFFAGPFISLFSEDARLQELGTQYLRIVCTWSVGCFMSILFERMLQSAGITSLSMAAQLSGALTNIILDPIMIFGLFGVPEMGIAGAATATVIGQWVGMLTGFLLNQKKNTELRLRLSECRIHARTLGEIIAVGVPSTVMSAISSLVTTFMNLILMPFGNEAVSVMGVYFKLQSFVFMPVFGLSNGMVPIIGYNYGARNRERVYHTIRVALKIAACIMAVGTLLFMLLPWQLMSLFEAGEAGKLTELGVPALRIVSLSFIPAAVGITLSTVFQAVGRGVYSMLISICRQLLLLLPAARILAQFFGLPELWFSWSIAELLSLCLCLALFRKCDREMLRKL